MKRRIEEVWEILTGKTGGRLMAATEKIKNGKSNGKTPGGKVTIAKSTN